MNVEPRANVARDDYLAFEREAESRHEYWDGEILAMAGGSPEHNAICFNLATALGPQIRSTGCRGFTSDQRVRVPLNNRDIYPDLTVVCGRPVYDEVDPAALVNPTLVAEVLSPTTESRDRGSKLFGYRSLESLLGYLLVAQDRVWIEHWSRQSDGRWLVTEIDDSTAVLELPEIESRLVIAEVYEGISFDVGESR